MEIEILYDPKGRKYFNYIKITLNVFKNYNKLKYIKK